MKKAVVKFRSSAFLGLSACSGFLELGAVLFMLRRGEPLVVALFVGLSYQLGALAKNPLHLPPQTYRILLAGAAAASILVPYTPIAFATTMALLAAGLQGIRDEAAKTTSVGTLPKRLSRVAGFAVAGFLNAHALSITAVICLAVSFVLLRGRSDVRRPSVGTNWRPGKLGIIMLTHQAHYFSYAYVLPFVLIQHMSVFEVGLVFAAGWVTYASSQVILQKADDVAGFTIGHLFASGMLLVIFFGHTYVWATVVGWLLTGFGGGTVFLLRRLQTKADDGVDLDMWENLGHAAGVLISILLVWRIPSSAAPFAMAASLAIAAGIQLILRTRKRNRRYEGW